MNTHTPSTMAGVQLTSHGGLDKLVYREDLPVPAPGSGDVLIKCHAAGINNTDINTRIGWYSKRVTRDTGAGGAAGLEETDASDASWSGKALEFPRIQGADCFGTIVDAGRDVDRARIGERVLVRTMLRAPVDFRPYECWTFGSECDGGFAEYAVAPSRDTYAVESGLSDAELGAIPCAYGTAEGMLVRARITGSDRVLITGASGGVGSAAVQLAKVRGAEVVAVSSRSKRDAVLSLGADEVVEREGDWLQRFGENSFTAVVDLVAGPDWPAFPALLDRGGRYVTAGAIAGPIVEMDVRSLYLKDLSLFGCAFQEDVVFENIVRYISEDRLRPVVAATYPLSDIHRAQEAFLAKGFVGKIVLIP